MKHKRCIKCLKYKLITTGNFRLCKDKRNNKSYYRPECRKCESKYQKKYHFKNREKVKKYKKGYRKNNKNELSKYQNGYQKSNKERILKQRKEYRYINKNKIRWTWIHHIYHLGENWQGAKLLWKAIFKKQHGRCAICERKFSLKNRACTDHCHKTGKFRGLLCHRCNRMLDVAEKYMDNINNYLKVGEK